MSAVWTIFKKELSGFFNTPIAYIFVPIFLCLSAVFTFMFGALYERGEADLLPFFNFHPWLYLVLVPAIAMRIWAEERKSGTIELLVTLPLPLSCIVLGKFLAAWMVIGLCLVLTTPLWISVNYLGTPDNGVILASYLSSWLMSGAFLAMSMTMSALSKNQVLGFVMALVLCFLFVLMGAPMMSELMLDWAPAWVLDTVASFSLLTHFQDMAKGVINANNLVYFLSTIVIFLSANYFIIHRNKAS